MIYNYTFEEEEEQEEESTYSISDKNAFGFFRNN